MEQNVRCDPCSALINMTSEMVALLGSENQKRLFWINRHNLSYMCAFCDNSVAANKAVSL